MDGYKQLHPLEIGIPKIAEYMNDKNICFLVLTQQVGAKSTESYFK